MPVDFFYLSFKVNKLPEHSITDITNKKLHFRSRAKPVIQDAANLL